MFFVPLFFLVTNHTNTNTHTYSRYCACFQFDWFQQIGISVRGFDYTHFCCHTIIHDHITKSLENQYTFKQEIVVIAVSKDTWCSIAKSKRGTILGHSSKKLFHLKFRITVFHSFDILYVILTSNHRANYGMSIFILSIISMGTKLCYTN